MANVKARDASPLRPWPDFEKKYLRISCLKQHQWMLCYFGLALECDSPIMESLFWTTMVFLTYGVDWNMSHLRDVIVSRIRHLCPTWKEFPRKYPRFKSRTEHKKIVVSVDSTPGIKRLYVRSRHGWGFGDIYFNHLGRLVWSFYGQSSRTIGFHPGQVMTLVDTYIVCMRDDAAIPRFATPSNSASSDEDSWNSESNSFSDEFHDSSSSNYASSDEEFEPE